jgi:hypothetical protein
LKCGTSIGANPEESSGGQTGKDFLQKLQFHTKKQGKPITG